MFGLVFKNGFVGLTLACLAMAVTPVSGHAKPSEPPGQAKKDDGGPDAKGKDKGEEPVPPASETAPPPEEERPRVRIRSNTPPGPETELAQLDPTPAERPARERSRTDRSGRIARPETRRPAAPGQDTGTDVPVLAPAAPSAAKKPARTRKPDAEPEPATPRESLPARVVPHQVRRIAEVIPWEIWGVLAGLALLALALAASSWFAALRARRLKRQREELLQEVGLLQAALLPSVPAEAPVSVAYRPANGAAAGGDFYDAFTLADGRTGIILGDVSGHGRDALARTTFVRYTLRAYVEAGLEPREVLKVGAAALAEHLNGGFATVTIALHDAATGLFTYASAGHPPPLVTDVREPFEAVTVCSAPPLGIDEPTGFRQTTFCLTAGARACLHTDGVVEARVNGSLLGLGRLERAIESLQAGASAEQLLDAVAEMADEIPDDMAVCLINAAPDAPVAGPRIEELEVDERDVGDLLEQFLRACGVPLLDVPGILREAGEAARREGSATVRVRLGDFRPGVDVVSANLVSLAEHRTAAPGVRPLV